MQISGARSITRALHPTALKETAQHRALRPLLSQVLVCVEESSETLIQHDPAEPAVPRQQAGDGEKQPDTGKLPGSPAGPCFGRALGCCRRHRTGQQS